MWVYTTSTGASQKSDLCERVQCIPETLSKDTEMGYKVIRLRNYYLAVVTKVIRLDVQCFGVLPR
jgi:hypothetical protein